MLNGFFTFIFAAAAELCEAFVPHNGFAERNKGAFPQLRGSLRIIPLRQ